MTVIFITSPGVAVPPLISQAAAVVLVNKPDVCVGDALAPVIATETISTGTEDVKTIDGHCGVSPSYAWAAYDPVIKGTPDGVALLMVVPLPIVSPEAPTRVTSVTSRVISGAGLRNCDALKGFTACGCAPAAIALKPMLTVPITIVMTMSKLRIRLGLHIQIPSIWFIKSGATI